MAIFAGALATAKAAFVGASTAIKAFIVKHSAGLATAATVTSSALSGTSFEGKNKKIVFGSPNAVSAGGNSFSVPSFQVSNVRSSNSYNQNKGSGYKRNASKSTSSYYRRK